MGAGSDSLRHPGTAARGKQNRGFCLPNIDGAGGGETASAPKLAEQPVFPLALHLQHSTMTKCGKNATKQHSLSLKKKKKGRKSGGGSAASSPTLTEQQTVCSPSSTKQSQNVVKMR